MTEGNGFATEVAVEDLREKVVELTDLVKVIGGRVEALQASLDELTRSPTQTLKREGTK